MSGPLRPLKYATEKRITPGGMFGLTPNVPYSATLEDLEEANKDREGLHWELQRAFDRVRQLEQENEELKKERQSRPKTAGSVTDWWPLLQQTRDQLKDARFVLYNIPNVPVMSAEDQERIYKDYQKVLQVAGKKSEDIPSFKYLTDYNKAIVALQYIPRYPAMDAAGQAALAQLYQEVLSNRGVQSPSLQSLIVNPKLTECLEKQNELEAQILDLKSKGLQTNQEWIEKAKILLRELPKYPTLDILQRGALQEQYRELLDNAPDLDSTLGLIGQAEESLRDQLDRLQSERAELLAKSETFAYQLLDAQDQLGTLQKSCAAAQVSGEIIEQLTQCQKTLKECQDRNASARRTVEEISSGLGLEGNVLNKRLALEGTRIRSETVSAAQQREFLDQCRQETKRLNEENGDLRRQIEELKGPVQGGFDKRQFDRLTEENEKLKEELKTTTKERDQAFVDYEGSDRDILLCQGDIELLQKIIGELSEQKRMLTSALEECIQAGLRCAAMPGFEDLEDLSQKPTRFVPIQIGETKSLIQGSGVYRRPDFEQLLQAANGIQ